jgi:hypothetical protein
MDSRAWRDFFALVFESKGLIDKVFQELRTYRISRRFRGLIGPRVGKSCHVSIVKPAKIFFWGGAQTNNHRVQLQKPK